MRDGLINQGQLLAAFQAWTLDKSKSLAEQLESRGDLTAAKRALLDGLAAVHLEAHGDAVVRGIPHLVFRPSLRTRFLLPEDSPQVFLKRRKERLFSQWPAGLFVRSKELYVLLANHSREKTAPVWGQIEQRSDRHHPIISAACMGCRAAPSIPGWRLDQPRSHWVQLNVPRGS